MIYSRTPKQYNVYNAHNVFIKSIESHLISAEIVKAFLIRHNGMALNIIVKQA